MNAPITRLRAAGDRVRFETNHAPDVDLAGQPCTVMEVYGYKDTWEYRVRFDDGTELPAVERNLKDLEEPPP